MTAQHETKIAPAKAAPASENSENLNKRKMLELTFAQIDKQHGKGLVMFLGDAKLEKAPVISSGSILINDAVGIGGYPLGRIVEIYGPEASGKTTLALHAIAQAQRNGGICAYIDAEHALDTSYAANLGVNINDLIISQPDYGEQGLDIAEMLVRSGSVDIVVVDSVAALVPKAELDGDMGDVHVGLQARLMSQALRKLTPVVHKSKTVLIFINQIRHNINSMPFANKETTTGGNALKFYASLRLDVRRIASLKKDDNHFGNRVSIKVVKNKMAPPFKKVELDVLFGEGISHELDVLDAALHYGVVEQSGAWLAFEKKKFAQGREQALAHMKENPEFVLQVESAIAQVQAAQKEK
ncbi:MAG TPA: recombinase RecA [Candidatus Babeliales bacterium]|nr:recombinase RecA [Candidatus Babeliales bacterium]